MSSYEFAGSVIIGIAGVLLASHYRGWRELVENGGDDRGDKTPVGDKFQRRLLRRRTYASGLMALLGVAIFMKSVVPIQTTAVSLYLLGLLAAVFALVVLAIGDWAHLRDQQHRETLASLHAKLADHLEQQRRKVGDQRKGR